jgi:hypothetical protein
VKSTGRDEPIRVVIDICIGTKQGNSLCRYLYLTLAKMHASLFIFYVFFFYKIRELKGGTGSSRKGGTRGRGKVEKGVGR